ncbi:MAG: hypothetical protein Fur006_55430 [Coleofasciculaceae cyanobacterium]
MVRVVEELEPPSWDFSWMDNIQQPFIQSNPSDRVDWFEEMDQPSWDYSWVK